MFSIRCLIKGLSKARSNMIFCFSEAIDFVMVLPYV
ncbi:hypothetical protein CFU_1213 [Collimonas fungivorans Ter331]|uniref:Uncharacterized protein n=1 Tax=Collimonas fungivorans (strain Ter331) TaxID=1005048 RepID=G0AJB1_COLFT|nr:hypothetical protein CFU_1213 [Collimonas fungivorans Ter331]